MFELLLLQSDKQNQTTSAHNRTWIIIVIIIKKHNKFHKYPLRTHLVILTYHIYLMYCIDAANLARQRNQEPDQEYCSNIFEYR